MPIRSPSSHAPAPRGGGLGRSFVHAWNGLLHAVANQRNLRIHLVCALLVAMVGSGIPLGLAEKVTLIVCVLLVFFAEILNTSLESLVDLATEHLDERARVAKDAAAAGVLVLATGTVVIFGTVLYAVWPTVVAYEAAVWRRFALGIPLATCVGFVLGPGRRSGLLRGLLSLAACGFWAATLPASESTVFSVMAIGLVLVAAAASQWGAPRSIEIEPAERDSGEVHAGHRAVV